MGYKVAVVGATGNVGRQMLEILAERKFPADEVVALASRKSMGQECTFGDKTLKVKALDHYDFSDVDICLMSAGGFRNGEIEGGKWLFDIDPRRPMNGRDGRLHRRRLNKLRRRYGQQRHAAHIGHDPHEMAGQVLAPGMQDRVHQQPFTSPLSKRPISPRSAAIRCR